MIELPPVATKNGRRRHVPISDNMHRLLEDLKKQSVKGCALVFHMNGKTIPTNKLEKTWRKAADKAGYKGLRLHDARHSLASWLVMGGEDLYTVATILGHSSLNMAQRYSHLAPGHLRAAMRHADLDPPKKCNRLYMVPDKSMGVSMPNIMEDDHADDMQDGTPADVKVGMLLKEGFGLNAILNEVVKRVLESNGFNKKATAKELGISRSTLIARMEAYRIPKSWYERIPPAGRIYPKGTTLKQAEEAIIRQAMEANGSDKSRTARALGIARGTLANKMKKYEIAPAQVEKITEKTPKNVHQLFTSEVSPSDSLSEYARNPLLTEGKSKSGALPRAPENVPHPTQSLVCAKSR
jgi:DNA-binding protein Fis